jgi:glycosyltransferase involved in cell wall biosynthesis
MKSNMFLTFLIITYRRPEKVKRLLNLFLDSQWDQVNRQDFEIVIADDHGEDNTHEVIKPILQKLENKGWRVKYIYRDANLRGDRNLYYGFTRDSSGEYVWFLCDDDLIDVQLAINYIETVQQLKPFVSMCGFTQGADDQLSNSFGDATRIISDFPEAVNYLIKFPKTTAYMMRRFPDINLDEIFERWDNTLFSWIGIPVYLLAQKKHNGVLVYPTVVAKADDDFGKLRYSYRTFAKLLPVVKDSIELANISFEDIAPKLTNLGKATEFDQCVYGLIAHYSWRSYITYTPEILKKELEFFREHWTSSFNSSLRIVYFIKLAIYVICSYIFKKGL